MPRLFAALCCCTALIAADPVHPELPFDLDQLTLIDEVDLGSADPGHRFQEFPAGAAERDQILGRPALSLRNQGDLKFVAVRLGEGKGLAAGERYILCVDFPEDQPRSFVITNSGCETRRGVHTGTTVGDAMNAPSVGSHSESIAYPLSQRWRTWTHVFRLHPRFPDLGVPGADGLVRSQRAADGITVVISQFAAEYAPLSHGAAVGTVRLYAAPTDDLAAPLAAIPEDLPQRHLFVREEASDGVVGRDSDKNGFPSGQELDWYRGKIEDLQFLGMNTFSKDLLEFGANQGWDSSRYGGNDWVFQNHDPQRWSRILDLVAETDLTVLPYYEYHGSIGKESLGRERRSQTLHQRGKGKDGRDDYTHIWWSEKANADVTDPDTFEDFRRMLEITVSDESEKVDFLGVWLRPRPSGLPVSFSDRCIDLFNTETGRSVTREELERESGDSYEAYWDWWFGKREQFFNQVRDYLWQEVGDDAVLLYTADPSEAGRGIGRRVVVSDDPSRFPDHETVDFASAVAENLHYQTQIKRHGTWGGWEWQHSIPPPDPERYRDNPGVALTYGFNSLASVSNPEGLQSFASAVGLAMVRHYHLNENMMMVGGDKNNAALGKFLTDMELAGPYSVLAEARALANGDPRFIGYLSAQSYTRGFPEYVRAFNQAFLALPAIPSERLESAASNDAVVVRRYVSAEHGNWYAVINTDLDDVIDVELDLPDRKLVDCLSGEAVTAESVSLYPGQVLAWRTP